MSYVKTSFTFKTFVQLAPTPFQHTVHFGSLLHERKPGPGFVSISPHSITYVAIISDSTFSSFYFIL